MVAWIVVAILGIGTLFALLFYYLGPVYTKDWKTHWWLLSTSFKKPVPPMEGFMDQHLSVHDHHMAKFYYFLSFKFMGTRLASVGARGMGRLDGKYNVLARGPRVVK
jgi:hypothetical protein